MYAVVGCSDCSNLWIVEGQPETSRCPRCGSRRPFANRKSFVETENVEHAREVRASMLAARAGHADAYAELDSIAALESTVEDGVFSDEEYLVASGLDQEAIESAGADTEIVKSQSKSNAELVECALEELDRPTEAEVIEWTGDRGVSADYVRKTLDKLTRRGEVSENRGRYRLL